MIYCELLFSKAYGSVLQYNVINRNRYTATARLKIGRCEHQTRITKYANENCMRGLEKNVLKFKTNEHSIMVWLKKFSLFLKYLYKSMK